MKDLGQPFSRLLFTPASGFSSTYAGVNRERKNQPTTDSNHAIQLHNGNNLLRGATWTFSVVVGFPESLHILANTPWLRTNRSQVGQLLSNCTGSLSESGRKVGSVERVRRTNDKFLRSARSTRSVSPSCEFARKLNERLRFYKHDHYLSLSSLTLHENEGGSKVNHQRWARASKKYECNYSLLKVCCLGSKARRRGGKASALTGDTFFFGRPQLTEGEDINTTAPIMLMIILGRITLLLFRQEIKLKGWGHEPRAS